MPTWKIIGAHAETGADMVVLIDSASAKSAEQSVDGQKILVSSVARMPTSRIRAALAVSPLILAMAAIAVSVFSYVNSRPPQLGKHPDTPEHITESLLKHDLDVMDWTGLPAWAVSGGNNYEGTSSAMDSFRVAEVLEAGDYAVVLYDYTLGSGLEKKYRIFEQHDGKWWLSERQFVTKYSDDPFPGLNEEDESRLVESILEWD